MLNLFKKAKEKFASGDYWENRYKAGGNSGSGSYNHLAEFKAEVINELLETYSIKSLIEFGCGDGNQLSMLKPERYTGLDVAPTILQHCKKKFSADKTKSFFLYNYQCFEDNEHIFRKDASMSIDVLFHLVEDDVYESYLRHLFNCGERFVIIYAADVDIEQKTSHEKFRKFTRDVEKWFPEWKLEKFIKNKYPSKNYEDESGSLADFFIYKKL